MRLEIEHGQKIWVVREYLNFETNEYSFEFEPGYITLERDKLFAEKKKYHLVVHNETKQYCRLVDSRFGIFLSEEKALKCKEHYEKIGHKRYCPFEN